jgi:hypothetical protein
MRMKPIAPGPRLLICCLLTLGLLSGCGGDAANSALAQQPVDACQLLTAGDIESLYGKPAGEPTRQETGKVPTQPTTAGYFTLCSYWTQDVTHGGSLSVLQLFDEETAQQEFAETIEQMKKELGFSFTPLAELGDGAYWSADGGQLYIQQDNLFLIIAAPDGQNAGNLEQSKALAQVVLGRLAS